MFMYQTPTKGCHSETKGNFPEFKNSTFQTALFYTDTVQTNLIFGKHRLANKFMFFLSTSLFN